MTTDAWERAMPQSDPLSQKDETELTEAAKKIALLWKSIISFGGPEHLADSVAENYAIDLLRVPDVDD
jgi:hypothetical protein